MGFCHGGCEVKKISRQRVGCGIIGIRPRKNWAQVGMKFSSHITIRAAYYAALFCLSLGLTAALPSPAFAERFGHVLVVEDDGRILDAANPLSLDHRRLAFRPGAAGGYILEEGPARRLNRTLGRAIDFTAGDIAPSRVDLNRPIRFFGHLYQSIWVHPHGAIAFGESWPQGVAARATAPGDLLPGLLGGPPVVAGLWNELLPGSENSSGVFVHQDRQRVSISWLDVASVRPAGVSNTFFIEINRDGRVIIEYSNLATSWGVIGLSPGAERSATRIEDLRGGQTIGSSEAAIGWYRDRPRLNLPALSRRVHAEVADRFEFLTVFTDQPVDAPHLVYSETVTNETSGLGQPLFDHGKLFGSETLQHLVVMNDIGFWADDPSESPVHPAYDYAPSTLAVLAHETGHRWVPRFLEEPFMRHAGSGHWSPGLSTAASFLGGAAFEPDGDGAYRVSRTMERFGYLDRYLMGLIDPEEVPPFFAIDVAEVPERPYREGQIVTGTRRELVIEDLIVELGERYPSRNRSPKKFNMGFVLVVPSGSMPQARDIYKIQTLRRAFVPFFRKAAGGQARMATGLGARQPIRPIVADVDLLAGRPTILKADLFVGDDLATNLDLDWADFGGDLISLEIAMKPATDQAPIRVDLAVGSYGRHRGAVQLSLAGLPADTTGLEILILDGQGRASPIIRLPMPL
jgi:hypothetical protein